MSKSKMMWMGPRNGETWVPAPATGGIFTPVGFAATQAYLNGGINVRTSSASHMEYNMSWTLGSRDALRAIRDMKSGKRGPGLIYFIDPMAASYNVLSEGWAYPAQAADDAVPIIGDARPALAQTPYNTFDYPMMSAIYATDGTPRSIYIPIPPGYCAWVGFQGSVTGATGMQVTPQILSAAQAPVTLTPLPVTTSTRVNASFDSASGYTGIELAAIQCAGGTIIASGMIVQILTSGTTPSTGNYISGQGHSGCAFEGAPNQTAYSAVQAGAEIGLTAKLTERGDWI